MIPASVSGEWEAAESRETMRAPKYAVMTWARGEVERTPWDWMTSVRAVRTMLAWWRWGSLVRLRMRTSSRGSFSAVKTRGAGGAGAAAMALAVGMAAAAQCTEGEEAGSRVRHGGGRHGRDVMSDGAACVDASSKAEVSLP